MFFTSKDVVGIDIGSGYLKAVQLKEKKGNYELVAFDMLQLPPELIVEGSIIDSLRLVESIRELMKKSKIRAKDAAIGIGGHSSVIIRKITLPEMTDEELAESIKFEAEQYVPFDVEDVNIDFQILGQKDEPGKMEVMLVAVKKDIINEYTNVVRESGLIPVVVDVNDFTIGNAYELNYETDPDHHVAIINVGASTININILRGNESVFTRDSSIGSNLHTEALQKEFNLSFEQAEKLKQGEAIESVDLDLAASALGGASEEIIGEIRRSIDYFRSTSLHGDLYEVYTSGGGALVRNFNSQLADNLGVDVKPLNPFAKIKVPSKLETLVGECGAIAAVAVGLAIRKSGDR